MDQKKELFRQRVVDLGFDEVCFASLAPDASSPEISRGLEQWLAAGLQADMAWMERTKEKRLTPDLVLPGARSIIMLGINYWSERLRRPEPAPSPPSPRWARYALYEDYHDSLKPALAAAGRLLEEMYGASPQDYRYYVDTGPVLERSWAERSGLGFVGRNAMLISPRFGNWLFLAAMLTRVPFAPDAPVRPSAPTRGIGLLCGTCTRCLAACPTDAFPQPGVVDARRCISYQTIENKGVIPRKLRAGIGDRIFGCDICLEVCPWNRFAQEGRRVLLSARYDVAALTLPEILTLTPARFAEVFRRTPIKRLKLTGLLRNACVVAGNSGDRNLLPLLAELASGHESPLVRAHAVWAVGQLGGAGLLRDAAARETELIVRSEYEGLVASG